MATIQQARLPESLGNWLKRARLGRELSLEAVARETKIPQRYLEALERDDLAAMPTLFYQRAEVRAFARAVGVDQESALARLESLLPAAAETPSPGHVPPLRESLAPVAPVIAVIVLATLAAAVMRGAVPDAPAPEPQSLTAAAAAPPADPAPAQATAPLQNPAPATVGAPETSNTPTELVVTTQPPGARVTVDGISWGTSPVTIRYLPPGDKRVRVSKSGYTIEERTLQLAEGRPKAVAIPLTGVR